MRVAARRLRRHRLDGGRGHAARRREHAAFLVSLPAGTRVAGARLRPGRRRRRLLGVDGRGGARRAASRSPTCGATPAGAWPRRSTSAPDPVGRRCARRWPRGWRAPRRPTRSCARRSRGWRDPAISVAALAGELGVSERQLRRRVDASPWATGPKRLARVLRLARALEAARGGERARARGRSSGLRRPGALRQRLPRLAGVAAVARARWPRARRGRFLQDAPPAGARSCGR